MNRPFLWELLHRFRPKHHVYFVRFQRVVNNVAKRSIRQSGSEEILLHRPDESQAQMDQSDRAMHQV